MPIPFLVLCVQTLVFWALIILLYRQKQRFTLIPLYAFLSVLTLLTHHLSDLGFAVIVGNWYFLIASFSFFTTLMLGILIIYLFEGPRATRLALYTILFISFFYVGVVYLLSLQVDTSKWVPFTVGNLKNYLWSVFAIVIDVFFITISWEFLGKARKLPLFLRIALVILGTYLLDSLIFVTGVFGAQPIYASVLQGSLLVRFILAIMVTPVAHFYLKAGGYSEDRRERPQKVWEILNFRSDLEAKIKSMEDILRVQKDLESKLRESEDKYTLALEGANAGIWDWDIANDYVMYSAKFCSLLGFNEGELKTTIKDFGEMLHPDDKERTFKVIEDCFAKGIVYSIEYRLKNKDNTFKWYLSGGIVKYNQAGKPARMVGSIIDINDKKLVEIVLAEKATELERFNNLMIDRETKIIELKEEIKTLKGAQSAK